MGLTDKELTILIKARDDASGTLAKIQRQVAGLNGGGAGGGGFIGGLHSVKSALGGRSDFKEVFELLKGGGAIAGLSFASSAIKDIADSVTEAARAGEQVDKTAGDMTASFLTSLPVVGNVANAFNSVRIAAQDTLAKIAESSGASREWVEYLRSAEGTLDRMQKSQAVITGLQKQAGGLSQQAQLAGLGPDRPIARQLLQAQFTRDDQLRALQEAQRSVDALPPEARREGQRFVDQMRAAVTAIFDQAVKEAEEAKQELRKADAFDRFIGDRGNAEQKQREADFNRQQFRSNTRNSFVGAVAGALQAFADPNDPKAQETLQKLAIFQQGEALRAPLLDLINNPNSQATAPQKERASAIASSLLTLQNDALENLKNNPGQFSGGLFGLQDTARLTGVSAASAENRTNEQITYSKRTAETLEKLYALIEKGGSVGSIFRSN